MSSIYLLIKSSCLIHNSLFLNPWTIVELPQISSSGPREWTDWPSVFFGLTSLLHVLNPSSLHLSSWYKNADVGLCETHVFICPCLSVYGRKRRNVKVWRGWAWVWKVMQSGHLFPTVSDLLNYFSVNRDSIHSWKQHVVNVFIQFKY